MASITETIQIQPLKEIVDAIKLQQLLTMGAKIRDVSHYGDCYVFVLSNNQFIKFDKESFEKFLQAKR